MLTWPDRERHERVYDRQGLPFALVVVVVMMCPARGSRVALRPSRFLWTLALVSTATEAANTEGGDSTGSCFQHRPSGDAARG